MRETRAAFAAFFRRKGLIITDVTPGDPDEVQITFKLAAGWGWDDLGVQTAPQNVDVADEAEAHNVFGDVKGGVDGVG